MNKKIIYLFLPLFFFLIINCSFDDKTGIWKGSEEEKRKAGKLEKEQRKVIDVIRIYSSEDYYNKEITATKNIILTKPNKNSSWEMPGLNNQNFTGNIFLTSIDNNFLKKKIGKNKYSFFKIKSSPLVYNNGIIFTDDTGTIFNINQNGKINWKINVYKKIYKKIYKNLTYSIHEGKIYVADNIGFIYSIGLKKGKLTWIKNHGIPLKSKVKIFEDKIFLINQDNRILCLDIKDGTKIWDVRTTTSFIKSQNFLALAISKDGFLFLLNSSGELFKIKASNGTIYWSVNALVSRLAQATDFFKSSDIVLDEKDIIFSTSSSIFSYDTNTGYLNWKQNIGSESTSIIDGKNIFLVSDRGYFVNLDKMSGKIIFSSNILKVLKKKKQNTYVTGFIMGSGKVYATTLNGYLIVSSATSGNIINFKKLKDQIAANPIISNGSLYVLTENSRILGFN